MSQDAPTAQAGGLLALGQATMSGQSFSTLLGTRLGALQPGYADLRLTVTPSLRQQAGVVHGGVLAYLADNAITFAAGSLLGPAVVTVDLKINYLRPAREGELVATAEVVYSGGTLAVCRCDIVCIDSNGQTLLCAAAQGTVSRAQSVRAGADSPT